MIAYVNGNLFESPAKVLVNAVNTVGVMGKGIAKDFKTIYPEMFKIYQKHCENGSFEVGKLMLYKTSNKWVLNFPTKTTWKLPSKLEYIEMGLEKFKKSYAEHGITSIAFPPLGCGNGELNWETQVRPLMEKYLNKIPIDVFVHLYNPSRDAIPEHRSLNDIKEWLRNEPECLAFYEVWQDLKDKFSNKAQVKNLKGKDLFIQVISHNKEGIELSSANNSLFVPLNVVSEIWGQIRNYGFCSRETILPGLEDITDDLLAVFAELKYCRKVSIEYKNTSQNVGIQLIPNSKIKNPNEQIFEFV